MLKERLIHLIEGHASRRGYLSSKIASACERYTASYRNELSHDMQINGERAVLEKLARFNVGLVFDVGANRGEWVTCARACLPQARVHCFEVVPEVASALRARFAGDARVMVHEVGLSSRSGSTTIRYDPDRPDVSTVYIGSDRWRGESTAIMGSLVTGASFCAGEGITAIDLVKVDTEGHDLDVLHGLAPLIPKAIRVIQFEYNAFAIDARRYLRDYFQFLAGYELGRILPRGVEFKPYSRRDENFRQANYLAVRRDLGAIIDTLRVVP